MTFNNFLFAQNDTLKHDDPDNISNQNLEILAEDLQSEDNDYTNLVEQLKYFQTHPININHTDKEELLKLGLLSELQVVSLLEHIEKNGKLISIYELQSVNGFDVQTIRKIMPYIKVQDNFNSAHFSFSEMIKNGRLEIVSRFQRNLESQRGYKKNIDFNEVTNSSPDTFYLGSPYRVFTRLRYTYSNKISAGFIAEKDAGEAFRKIDSLNKKAGFDFYTFHFFIRNIKKIKALAVGDYQASFGQGLVFWRGFGFGKNAIVTNIKRNARGLNQYNSVDENRFLRGAAMTFQLVKNVELTAFYSFKKLDANVSKADTISNNLLDAEEISSIILGGNHNTVGTLMNKDQITEKITGGNISYKGRKLNVGLTAVNYNLSADLRKNPTYYNQFDFQGRNNFNAGIDFSYIYQNVNFFGEGAISKNGGKAFCGGIIAALDPKFNFTAYYRNFEKEYQNTNALAISENTLPQNEKGLYLGFESKLGKNFSLSAFIDHYKFPWLKYTANSPSGGNDFFSQINWTPTKKIDMYVRYRTRTKQVNSSIPNQFDYLIPYGQQNLRYNVSFTIMPSLKLRTRIEMVTVKQDLKEEEFGFVFFQDVVWKKMGFPLSVTARYGLFETDSYNTRLYTYENDVLYSFSVPALYNKGQRAYLMLNYDVTRKIEVWFRIAQTFYTNQSIQNAGDKLNEINGPSRTEVKLQLRLKI
ncbi:MAG: hypothetical protein ACK452_10120 [Bacteroidota bacterium]